MRSHCCLSALYLWTVLVQPVLAHDGSQVPNPSSVVIAPHSEIFAADDLVSSSGPCHPTQSLTSIHDALEKRGGGIIPAGYHPLGYKITPLGERFLEFGPTCLESDVGRLLASLKTKRKTMSVIQTQWLEIVRVSKSGQSMRIYRTLQDLIDFCLAARLID